MPDDGPAWTLVGFIERLDAWAEQEKATTDLQLLVLSWVMSRSDDPYRGVRRTPGFPNLWFGAVPLTDDGLGVERLAR